MRASTTGRAWLAAACLMKAGEALGCPLCDSEAGDRVRRGIFDADFAANLAATLLPFGILLAVAGLIHFFGIPRTPRGPGEAPPPTERRP